MSRHHLFFLLFFCYLPSKAQSIMSTTAGGDWDAPSTWIGNVVPSFSNSTHIIIAGNVNISAAANPIGAPLVMDQIEITNGTITIESGAELMIRNGNGADVSFIGSGKIIVDGKLTAVNNIAIVGNTLDNFLYRAGSIYEHQYTSASSPLATASYEPNSTIIISSLIGGTMDNSWAIPVGNVIYNCLGQGSGTVNMNGMLRRVNGDLTIENTGSSGVLIANANGVSSQASQSSIAISGDLTIKGLSRFALTSSGQVEINVGGDLNFHPDGTAGSSQCASSGTGSITVAGNSVLSSGTWDLASGNAGKGNFIFKGDLSTAGALVTGTGTGSWQGSITFNGTSPQHIDASGIAAQALQATFDNNSGFILSGTLSVPGVVSLDNGALTIANGTLSLSGAILQQNGTMTSAGTGRIIIGGAGSLPLNFQVAEGSRFESFELNRISSVVNIASGFQVATLALVAGTLNNEGTLTIAAGGSVDINIASTSSRGILINPPKAVGLYDLNYNISLPMVPGAEFPTGALYIRNLTKSGSGQLTFINDVSLRGDLTIVDGGIADGGNKLAIRIGGNLQADGAVNFSTSNLTFAGPETSANFSGSSDAIFFNELIFGHGVKITAGFQIGGDISISDASSVMAITGDVTFAGNSHVIGGNIGLHNIVVLASSTLTAPADTIEISGNLTLVSSTSQFLHNNGVAVFTGTSSLQGSAPKTFFNVVVRPGGSLLTSSGVALLGDLKNDGLISFTSGTVTFAGVHQMISGISQEAAFFNMTINEGTKVSSGVPFTTNGLLLVNDSLTSNAGFTANGSLSITSTGNLLAVGSFSVYGATSISTAGSLVTLSSADVQFEGDVSSAGTLLLKGRTTFSGTSTLTGNGKKIFTDIMLSGTLTQNAVYTVAGNFTAIGNAILNAGGNTTFFAGEDCHFLNSSTGKVEFNNVTIAAGSAFAGTDTMIINGSFLVSGHATMNAGFNVAGNVSVAVDSGSLTVNNRGFSIGGSLTVSSGAEMSATEGADMVLSGNLSVSGSMSIASTIRLTGTTTMTGGGTKLFNTISVSGNFLPNATMTVTGNFLIETGGSIAEGSSTTTFSGASSRISNSAKTNTVFHNILISAGSELTNSCPLTANGTFRVAGNFIGGDSLAVGGTFTVSRGGTLTSGHDIEARGNLAISGVLNSNGIIRFTGATKITGAGTKNFTTIVITGSLTAFAGVMNIRGDLQNDGAFIPLNGTINFIGDVEKKIFTTRNSPTTINFYSISISGGSAEHDLVFDMDTNLAGVMTLSTAPWIDLDGISNDHVFTILSTNDNPATDGSIGAIPDDAVIEGDVTVQRYLSGEGRIYRYISCPVNGATVADWQESFPITGNFADPSDPGIVCGTMAQKSSPSLFDYDEATRAYNPFPASGLARDNPLTVGRGYAAFIRRCLDPTVLSASGVLTIGVNRGSVSIPVSHHDPVMTYNNLVGNPFPSAIDWDKVALMNVSPTIAIRDNATGIFQYYTRGGFGAKDIPNGVIAQGQAFWIRTTASAPMITIDENSKALSLASSGAIFYREIPVDLFQITLSGASIQPDKACIVLSPRASNSSLLDDIDAPKMNNQHDDPYEELPDVYTTIVAGSEPLAVNAISSIACRVPYHLSVRDLVPGIFSFAFTSSGVFSSLILSLRDTYAGIILKPDPSGTYTFTVDSDTASSSLNRFELFFSEAQIDTHLTLEGTGVVCGADSSAITILKSQQGIEYSALSNGQVASDTIVGNGGEVYLKLKAELLLNKIDTVKIAARSGCSSQILDSVAVVRKISSRLPAVNAAKRCLPGEISLTINDPAPGELYKWYQNDTTANEIHEGPKFSTILNETDVFYVSATDSVSGCESARNAVTAVVVQYATANISVLDENILHSNFHFGNRWYLNGELLSDTTSALVVSNSGLYKLQVVIQGCISEDERFMAVTGTNESSALQLYPNPVRETLVMKLSRSHRPQKVSLMSMLGEELSTVQLHSEADHLAALIDFRELAAGTYFIRIVFEEGTTTARVVRL